MPLECSSHLDLRNEFHSLDDIPIDGNNFLLVGNFYLSGIGRRVNLKCFKLPGMSKGKLFEITGSGINELVAASGEYWESNRATTVQEAIDLFGADARVVFDVADDIDTLFEYFTTNTLTKLL